MDNPMISADAYITAIIPVYQVAPYIERCVVSLQAQQLMQWRCVLTDDGCYDESGVLADDFARRDVRVMVVHQPNRGVAIARNRGLERIKTPYFTFIDPDDWIEPDHFQTLYDAVSKREKSVAAVGMIDHANDGTTITEWHPDFPSGHYTLSAPIIYKSGTLVNKAFSSATLGHLRFFENLEFGEDVVFSAMLMSKAVGGVYIDGVYCGYHYMRRTQSLAHGRSLQDAAKKYWDDTLILYQHREQLLSPSLFREWLFRSMSGHLTSIFSLRDAFALAYQFSMGEGRRIWRMMWRVKGAPEDSKNYAGSRLQARGYGFIFGWGGCIFSNALLFWVWNWIFRLVHKISRMVGKFPRR